MLGNRNLILDTFSEVYKLLSPKMDYEFWDLDKFILVPGIYVFGRQQFVEHKDKIVEMAQDPQYRIVFCNAAEGSWTLQSQMQMLQVESLIQDKKILLISGGEQQDDYPSIQYEHFLIEILNYQENHQAVTHTDEIYTSLQKPYDFLFLNGRARPHRKYLYEKLKRANLLDRALWTMLESRPSLSRSFNFVENDINVMSTISELRWLPKHYEVPAYRNTKINGGPPERTLIKHELFNREWGEIYLQPEPYIDTYFSLVTETVFEQPWPFRTEKIAKPIMMGHPFIVATSPGYYRDLHRIGFKTFGHIIDESFDTIEHHQDRMNRIVDIVKDLCQQDLASFLKECYNVCKYNQQHHRELTAQHLKDFPDRFINLITSNE